MLALRLVRAGRLGLRTLTATTQDSAGATENVADGVGPAAWTAASAAAAAASPLLADRYAALVQAGTLRHDPAQARAVQRLDRLGHELRLYTQRLEEHQREVAAHQARRDALRAPLMQAEEARLAAEEQAAAAAAQSRAAGGMRAWLARALGKQAGPTVPARTQHQRQTLARATVEARLDQQLGPPPLPPPAPKGVYLHGSVGSGKTLLMDLLSTLVAGEGCVPLQRRLHFNSAMVELHSRMHAIESQRMRRERQQMETYAAAVAQQQRRGAAAGEADPKDADHGSQQGEDGGGGGWQAVARLDPLADKLRRSKLARMAFRRLQRDMQARTASEHSEALAASNAAIVRNAARALIRGCDTLQLLAASGGEHVHAGRHGRLAALLCFDEMQISDVFSAVALKGLFEALLEEGCVIVATSNRAPSDLERHGLHEDIFDHFLASLDSAMDVVPLQSSHDYRRLLAAQAPLHPLPDAATDAAGAAPLHPSASYFFPLGPAASAALEAQWARVAAEAGGCGDAGDASWSAAAAAAPAAAADAAPGGGIDLEVMFGRRLRVSRAAGGAAWFTFAELMARPLGAPDYLAIAQRFHTVFIEGVPAMDMQVRDQARRFITLVDELYNHRCRLVASAAAPPDALFAGADHSEPIVDLESLQFETAVEGSRLRRDLTADGGVAPVAASADQAAAAARTLGGEEERFAFARAVSRLHEMQGELYLASRARC